MIEDSVVVTMILHHHRDTALLLQRIILKYPSGLFQEYAIYMANEGGREMGVYEQVVIIVMLIVGPSFKGIDHHITLGPCPYPLQYP